jgi:plastocyanin
MRAVLLTALALLLAGCGSSSPQEPRPAASGEPAPGRVEMRHNRFTPARVVVGVDRTVRWTNRDAVAHTVASAALHLSSEAIRPGQAFTFRPRRAGRFAYYCTIHAGQTGVLVVR